MNFSLIIAFLLNIFRPEPAAGRRAGNSRSAVFIPNTPRAQLL
jgi:hypothetical protein